MKELEFDRRVYDLQAVKNAAYDFSSQAIAKIGTGEEVIFVEIVPKGTSSDTFDALVFDFTQSVLDHQVRLETARDYKAIREMIVAQAFAPCDNLEELVKTFKP